MSHRQTLCRSIYFRRLVQIHRGAGFLAPRARLWQLRALYDRAHCMALIRF